MSEKRPGNFTQCTFSWTLFVFFPLWILGFLVLFKLGALDHFFAKLFYSGQGEWVGNASFFIKDVIHKGGKWLPAIVGIGSFLVFLLSFVPSYASLKRWRTACLYIVVCILACTLAVVAGKHFSGTSCPWSFPEFGGNGRLAGKCFPAGHASAGFSLFCLYFASRRYKPDWSKVVFWGILALGLVFGIARQSQGAHYFSHTLATMVLDFALCAAIYRLSIGRAEPEKKNIFPSHLWSLCLLVALFWVMVFNLPFFEKATAFLGNPSWPSLKVLLSAFLILLCAFTAVPLLLVFPIPVKILLTFFTIAAAVCFYFEMSFGTIINADMVRNALATNVGEAKELVTGPFLAEVVFLMLPPLALIWLSKMPPMGAKARVLKNIGFSLGFIGVGALCLFFSFQGISSVLRGSPVTRNMITPPNLLSAFYKTMMKDEDPSALRPRKVVDETPYLGFTHKQKRGELLVVVVGETARLANWGLAGYSRNTTPQLAARNVYAFEKTVSCGTSTDVSLPCMFSRIGRSDYDRKRILNEESLLPVLERAGVKVFWEDNQSGSKGVATPSQIIKIDRSKAGHLCKGDQCYDPALLAGLSRKVLMNPHGTTVVFMHQLGSHGPAYFKRYPKDFEVFKPVCKDEKLQNCTREQIVNAYDNSILYTDSFLAGVIDWLKGLDHLDTGLLYVSDHGESLGEGQMYLHGAPYMISPSVQKEVPMVLWLSESLKERLGLNDQCMREIVKKPASHEELYSSIMALLDVESSTYDSKKDFTLACRTPEKAREVARARGLMPLTEFAGDVEKFWAGMPANTP